MGNNMLYSNIDFQLKYIIYKIKFKFLLINQYYTKIPVEKVP